MMATDKRGGARTKAGPQSNNTSGLLGIRFRWNKRHGRLSAEAVCVVGKSQRTRSLVARPAREALAELIQLRADAGLPVPTLRAALKAHRRWRTNEAANYRLQGNCL